MKQIPFFPNTKDNTHCYQAVLRMVLKHYFPKRKYPYAKLDKLTGKKEGLWTWPQRGIIEMSRMGFQVKIIDNFDLQRFIHFGKDYLTDRYGKTVADKQDKHGDIESARRDARILMQKIKQEKRIPKISDILHLLNEEYLIVVNVNSKKLNRKAGYIGHFVVIFRMTESYLYLHDPGLPPRENRKVSFKVFEEAWGYPKRDAKNLTAYKINFKNI